MEFASSYVYDYDESDEECVSDGSLEYGMSASDSDEDDVELSGAPAPPVNPAAPAAPVPPPPPPPPPPVGISGVSAGGSGGMAPQAVPDHARFGFGSRTAGFLGGIFNRRSTSGAPPIPPRKEKACKKMKSHWRNEPAQQQAPVNGKRYRRADTNIVSIKFSQLIKPSDMHTGDAVYCTGCDAVFSHLSKITQQGDDKIWRCEFCGAPNPIDLDNEEIPKSEDTTFMVQPAPTTTASGKTGVDESLVIFCVDTSGSMCVTTEVLGKVRLRGSERLDGLQSLNDTREDQYLPGQRRNVTYVSRLQGVQAAVDHQLEQMVKDTPNRRVALITFSNEVTVVGDGGESPVTVAGDKLNNMEQLTKIGAETELPKTVKESRRKLGDKVFDLEERGGTALGPALVVAISMACRVPGSKVIICTDGMSNVGLGSLEGIDSSEDLRNNAETFYTTVSSMAVDKGVSVSVTSIKGTDCKLVELGKVADVTGGQVNIVDPLKLTQEFGTILSDPIIATNVKATFITHAGLYVRDDDAENDDVINQTKSRAVRNVGNVTKETEITFEFGVKKSDVKGKKKDIIEEQPETSGASASTSGAVAMDTSSNQPSEMPFQIQITYTDLDGAQALRLITKSKPVTKDRAVAEKQLNLGVLGVHTAQKSAALALKGQYTQSRLNSHVQQRLVSRWTKEAAPSQRHMYKNFVSHIKPMENMLMQQQQMEKSKSSTNRTCSDDEDSDVEDNAMDVTPAPSGALSSAAILDAAGPSKKKGSLRKGFTKLKPSKSKVLRERKAECSDASYEVLFNLKQAKSNLF